MHEVQERLALGFVDRLRVPCLKVPYKPLQRLSIAKTWRHLLRLRGLPGRGRG